MMTAHVSINRDQLDWLLKRSFVQGVSWPIDRASLRALFDMGLTVVQVARYFSVDPVEVQALLIATGPRLEPHGSAAAAPTLRTPCSTM